MVAVQWTQPALAGSVALVTGGGRGLALALAGVSGPVGPAWEIPEQDWWRTVEVNLRSVELCSRLVLPEMVARRRGRIVNMTSQAGVFRWPLASAYSVSKAAVVKFTEDLGVETRRHGISVFSVHPGILAIGFGEPALTSRAPADSPQGRLREWGRREIAAGRGVQPHQIAELLLRIATGEVDRLSGRHLSVHDDLDMQPYRERPARRPLRATATRLAEDQSPRADKARVIAEGIKESDVPYAIPAPSRAAESRRDCDDLR